MSKEETELESVEQIIEPSSNLSFLTSFILGIIFIFPGFLLIILSIFSIWPILSIWPMSLSTEAMSIIIVVGVFLVLHGFIMVLLYRIATEKDRKETICYMWERLGKRRGGLYREDVKEALPCGPIQVSQNNV